MKKNKKKNLLNPITVIILFILLTLGISTLFSLLGKIEINNTYPFSFLSQGTYSVIDTTTGDVTNELVEVDSLLNAEGIQYIAGNLVSNFVSFAPLAVLLIALIGISVMEKSGLLKSLMSLFNPNTPNWFFTALIIFVGVISTLISDVGYVFTIPIAAIMFLLLKRHPVGGIVSAFAGVAGGYGINIMIGNVDNSLLLYTNYASKILDPRYDVSIWGNIIFMIIATILIVVIGTIVTEKIVIPKLPRRNIEYDELIILQKKEKRGLWMALVMAVVLTSIFIYMIIPNLPGSGILLDKTQSGYINQLLSSTSYFQLGLVGLISAIILLSSVFYGFGARTIKNDNDIINFITSSKNNVGYLILLLFFASQFIDIFKRTNLGTIVNVWFVNILNTLNVSGLPLVVLFFIFVLIGNLFLPSYITKWSILAPSVVPLFMQSSMTPEFAQMIYRCAISSSNLITPLLAFYVIYLGYLQIYTKQEDVITIGKSFKLTMPYFLFFSLIYIVLIIIWYVAGLPLGPTIFPPM